MRTVGRALILALAVATQAGCATGWYASAGPVVGYVPNRGFSFGWSAGGGLIASTGTSARVPIWIVPVTYGQSYRRYYSVYERTDFVDIGLTAAVPVVQPYESPIPMIGVAGGVAWKDWRSKPSIDLSAGIGVNYAPWMIGSSGGSCSPTYYGVGASVTIGVRFLYGEPEIFLTPQFGIGGVTDSTNVICGLELPSWG